jgi:hypothetical protein
MLRNLMRLRILAQPRASSTSMAQSCDKADLFGYWDVVHAEIETEKHFRGVI